MMAESRYSLIIVDSATACYRNIGHLCYVLLLTIDNFIIHNVPRNIPDIFIELCNLFSYIPPLCDKNQVRISEARNDDRVVQDRLLGARGAGQPADAPGPVPAPAPQTQRRVRRGRGRHQPGRDYTFILRIFQPKR